MGAWTLPPTKGLCMKRKISQSHRRFPNYDEDEYSSDDEEEKLKKSREWLLVQEAGNSPFCPFEEKFHAFV